MTYADAVKSLPAGAEWSTSFGYPSRGGYAEYWRMPDGSRRVISNGDWCNPFPERFEVSNPDA